MTPRTPAEPPGARDALATVKAVCDELIARAASLVLDRPLWLVTLGVVFVRFLKAPLATWDLLGHELRLARALPHLPHFAHDDWFLVTSPTGPILAHLLGMVSRDSYVGLHIAIIVIGLTALMAVILRTRGVRPARVVMLMLVASDVAIFLGNTIGGYDVFTFIASSFLVLATSAPAVLISAIALGFFHFEQGVFIGTALLIVGPKRSLGRRRTVALVYGGLLIGKVALTAFLLAVGAPLNPRTTYAAEEVFVTLGMAIYFFPAMVYAAMGPAWVWLAALMFKVGRHWGQVRRGFFALAFLSVPMMLTMDETRVYALISWPVIMTLTLVAERRATEKDFRYLVGITTLAMVVLPSGWVWLGQAGFPDLASTKGMEIHGLRVFLLALLLLLPPASRRAAPDSQQCAPLPDPTHR